MSKDIDDDLVNRLRARISNPAARIDMDTIPQPAFYAPASLTDVEHAEAALAMKLPPFLRRLYLEVGNGGYGPGAGLIGIAGGYPDFDGQTLVTTYQRFRTGAWPSQLLPLWDWGDTMWSCVDVTEGFAVVTHDGTEGATKTTFTLQSLLRSWLDEEDLFAALYEIEDAVMLNPFTGKPVPRKKIGRAIGTPVYRRR